KLQPLQAERQLYRTLKDLVKQYHDTFASRLDTGTTGPACMTITGEAFFIQGVGLKNLPKNNKKDVFTPGGDPHAGSLMSATYAGANIKLIDAFLQANKANTSTPISH